MNTNTTSKALSQLDDSTDMLTVLLRNGARQLISQAVEAELAVLLEEHNNLNLQDGCKELIAVEDGYCESEASWLELLNGVVAADSSIM